MPAHAQAFCVSGAKIRHKCARYAMVIRQKLSVSDFEAFLKLPENADKRFELHDGVICEMAPSSALATVIAMRLAVLIGNYVYAAQRGVLTGADGGFQLTANDVLAPDVAFIRAERLTGIQRRGFFQIAPDLAIEVVSPSDSIPAVQRKAARYLTLGVREVWIIYPDEQTADIYRLAEAPNRLEVRQIPADGALESDLLPEFRLPLQQLFTLGTPILDDDQTAERPTG
ncbi:MAG: Uma2 family endonuclease [Candidatus Thermofonsia Clade 1 bacterium]|uniref:Uma2 family endonuclease n=1 Tax=Candidatus Thermofonsia Clade 1 bacterium TaxID=2364210 RepID=A0A2M8PX58_9CHLR|nr:MAG: Uma2 family endonuclease [Candidatus Thermofonsia Clade 1 bacterium]